MYDPSIHLPDKPNFSHPVNRAKYEIGTPLTDELIAYIGVRGPITVADYMRRALRDGKFGYYTDKGSREVKRGDNAKEKERKREEATREDEAEEVTKAVAHGQMLEMDPVDNDWDLENDEDIHAVGEQIIGSSGDFSECPAFIQPHQLLHAGDRLVNELALQEQLPERRPAAIFASAIAGHVDHNSCVAGINKVLPTE